MNVVLMDENPANRKFGNISYDWAFLNNSTYNKDLPVSPLNPLPSIKTIAKPLNTIIDNGNQGYSKGTGGGEP
jgi:hypothetical protein